MYSAGRYGAAVEFCDSLRFLASRICRSCLMGSVVYFHLIGFMLICNIRI